MGNRHISFCKSLFRFDHVDEQAVPESNKTAQCFPMPFKDGLGTRREVSNLSELKIKYIFVNFVASAERQSELQSLGLTLNFMKANKKRAQGLSQKCVPQLSEVKKKLLNIELSSFSFLKWISLSLSVCFFLPCFISCRVKWQFK